MREHLLFDVSNPCVRVVSLSKTLIAVAGIALCGLGVTYAQPTTFATGSFIVNMGVTPQTVGNGLKPYGMVYDLVKNYNVPIAWVINPAKAKDGIDFSHNGIDYRGGPFIIPAEYRTPTVNARITFWQGQGVVGATTVSPITVPVALTLVSMPTWTLDAKNGAIAAGYFVNAGIPSSAYNWLEPSLLTCCNDIFVMPHADPVWATHQNLLGWNQTCRGAIWAACHAVSALEDMFNPVTPSQQTNFLANKTGTATGPGPYSENALVLWGNHGPGSPPYSYAHPTDPVMQFMGILDAATQNGSEQIYLPKLSWRSTTKIGVWDPTQADVPSKSPGLAAVVAYGQGFGDSNRGKVMYEGGHSHNRALAPANIAAQRAFFNFGFWASKDKELQVTVTGVPSTMIGGSPYSVSATVTASVPAGPYTYAWSSTCGGTFANPAAASTTFTPPTVTSNTPCIVQVKVSDACGRTTNNSNPTIIIPGPRPPVLNNDVASLPADCATSGLSVTINVLANDSDPDGDPLTITGVTGTNGTWTFNPAAGTVTFSPAPNFTGVATATYTVCALSPYCATATITVNVGTPDVNGCFPGKAFLVDAAYFATAQTNTAVTNPNNALGEPDYDPADATTYAVLDAAGDILTLDFGSIYTPTTGDSVRVYFASSANSSNVTMALSYSTAIGGPYTSVGTFTTNDAGETAEAAFPVPMGGVRYVRIVRFAGPANLRIDAAEVEDRTCQSVVPIAVSDVAIVREDIPFVITVLANDQSPVGLPLKVTQIVSGPSSGRVSISPDGQTVTYLSNTDYSGSDAFVYEVCDTDGYCATATVSVVVVDDGCPTGQYWPVNFGSPVTITLTPTNDCELDRETPTANDNNTDLEIGKRPNRQKRGVFTFDISSIPAGSVIQTATLRLNRIGGDKNTLSMSVHRLTEAYNEAQATWNNRLTGTPWTTAGGTFDPAVWSTANVDKANGFKDFPGLAGLVQGWRDGLFPNNGLLVKQTNETAVDKKQRFATREAAAASRPQLVITYLLQLPCTAIPNRAPLANPDLATTPSNTPVSIPVLTNDIDPDGSPLTLVSIVGAVTGGTATVVGTNVNFTPTPSFTGNATFLYRISDGTLFDTARVTVLVTNSAPDANNDSPSVNSNTSGNVLMVQANDSDPDGPAPLVMTILSGPTNGTATVSGPNILYTPQASFFGNDTIRYRICETSSPGSCDPPLCDTAFVFLTINNQPPIANVDVAATNGCQPTQIFVLANDSDPENGPLTITAVTVVTPGAGTASVDPGGGSITYAPQSGFSGPATLTYTVCDNGSPALCATATVTVTVSAAPPVNSPPIAVNDVAEPITRSQIAFVPVLANDSDPEGTTLTLTSVSGLTPPSSGTLSIFGTQAVFSPNPTYLGPVSFTYQVCDAGVTGHPSCAPLPPQCATATVTLNVINEPPQAVDDYYVTAINTPINITPTINDNEPDGDNIVLQPGGITSAGGTMVLNNNGTPLDPTDDFYVYTPPISFTGVDTFVYAICDDIMPPLCDTATIYILVQVPTDLQLVKTFSPMGVFDIGDNLTFTLTITNTSTVPATGVNVLDLLSSSYNYISQTGDGVYNPMTGIWAIGNLGAGQTKSISLTVQVVNFGAFANFAQIYTTDQVDVDSTPNNNTSGIPAEDDESAVLPACVPPATPSSIIRN